ncbi:hypothetical protein O1D80_000638 [Vibrio cholerae]|nr:hypothetical protein [Vibrio cholerae]KQA29093.1 hypothetical protein F546_07905 [Vibrio paracholerae 877-163]HDI3309032.1 hypothetical protein [Vibrio cholerae]HDI3345278.1 hypothetical protein [Vibrio cholerae]
MILKNLSKALGSLGTFVGEIDSEIGKLAVFSLRVKGLSKLSDLLRTSPIKEIAADTYVRFLMQVLVYPAELVIDHEEPKSGQISAEQAAQLGKDTLDKFSDLFLQRHEYLYRESITNRREEDGKVIVSFDEGDVIHPKQDNESPHEYLYRLMVLEKEALDERTNKIMAGIPKIGMLSDKLLSQYQTTNLMASSIFNSIEHYKNATAAANLITEPHIFIEPKISEPKRNLAFLDEIEKHNRLEDERKRKNEQLIQRQEQHLEAMVDIMSQSAEYMRNIDNNQSQAAIETKKASEESAAIAMTSINIARTGIRLAFWGIVLNVFVLTLTAFSAWLTWDSVNSGTQADQGEIQVISAGFDKLSQGFSTLADEMNKANKEKSSSEMALRLSDENSDLKILIRQQSDQIIQLKNEQAQMQMQIDSLIASKGKPKPLP